MTSRSLSDLQPAFATKAYAFQAACKKAGIDVLIYCTLRTNDEQTALFYQGRKTAGKIVTEARGGESYHNYGLAFDCVPLSGGKPMWNDSASYTKMGVIGEKVGLVWSGRWSGKMKETAHFQDSNESIDALKKKWPNGWSAK